MSYHIIKISPVTGFFITENNASYIYTGIETNYKLGRLNITPSFTPGLYAKGEKDFVRLLFWMYCRRLFYSGSF